MHHITYCLVGEACVRGGQAAIVNFLSLSFFFFFVMPSLHYAVVIVVGFIFGSTRASLYILRNVHVLWVRAPLSRTIPTDFPFEILSFRDQTEIHRFRFSLSLIVLSSSSLLRVFFCFTSPGPSRRTAITPRAINAA